MWVLGAELKSSHLYSQNFTEWPCLQSQRLALVMLTKLSGQLGSKGAVWLLLGGQSGKAHGDGNPAAQVAGWVLALPAPPALYPIPGQAKGRESCLWERVLSGLLNTGYFSASSCEALLGLCLLWLSTDLLQALLILHDLLS